MSKSSETDSTPISAEMSSFDNICEFLERPDMDLLGGYILSTRRTRPIFSFAFRTPRASESILLFSSTRSAREAAYMLRSNWDSVNAVTVNEPDPIAVHNVLELLKLELGLEEVECCQNGEYCFLPNKEQTNGATSPDDSKAVLIMELIMQGLEGLPPMRLELPNLHKVKIFAPQFRLNLLQ